MTMLRSLLSIILFIAMGIFQPLFAQSQKDSIKVQIHDDDPMTARFRVTVEFENSISNRSAYTIEAERGGGSVSLGPQDSPSSTVIGSGGTASGLIEFEKQDGKGAEIAVSADGILDDDNKCDDDDNASNDDKKWSLAIKYPSGNSISGYHFTSYRALSHDACNVDRRRNTDVPGATLSGDLASYQHFGPHPLDVAMVLDKSGSMEDDVSNEEGNTESKITALSDAALSTIKIWESLGGSSSNEDDRLGVVFFDRQAHPVMRDPFFVKRSAGWESFTDPTEEVTAGGSTAMGKGMREGFRRADVKLRGGGGGSGAKHDLAMFVMTDGKQNVVPKVRKCKTIKNSSQCGDDLLQALLPFDNTASSSNPIKSLPARKSLIQTVYVGPNASVTASLMDDIADQNGGEMKHTDIYEGGQIAGALADNLVQTLKGSTPGFILEEYDTLPEASNRHRYPFFVNNTARQLVATVDWRGHREPQALNVELVGPDSNVVTPSSREDQGGFSVLSYDLSGQSAAGQWEARVGRGWAEGDVEYEFILLAEDDAFSLRPRFRGSPYQTGDDLLLEVMLRVDGKPLTGVQGLRVRPLQPKEGFGNLLHERSGVTAPDLSQDQIPDAYSKKLYGLYQKEEIRSLVKPQPTGDSLLLSDDGDTESGDREADDGIYTVRLPERKTPGKYEFEVLLNQQGADIGSIQRTETVQAVVEVNATLDASRVDVAAAQEGGSRLRLTPRDAYGNYLGPGWKSGITVRADNGELLNANVTNESVNGTYGVLLPNVSPDSDRPLRISVGSVTFTETTMANLSTRGGLGWPIILLITIAGLLVLGFVAYLFFRRQRT